MRPIPESKGLPLIGTMLSLLAAGGAPKLHLYIDKRHREHGAIFREKLGPVRGIFISDANYMRKVFASEGKYPKHIVPESWMVYNEMYGYKRGLLFMDDAEWAKFRKPLSNLMLKSCGAEFTKATSVVAENLIETWRQQKVITRLEEQLYVWSLEVIVAILMGSDAYRRHRNDVIDDIRALGHVVHRIFVESAQLSLLPAKLAAKFKLPVWRRFVASVKATVDSGRNLLDRINEIGRNRPERDGLLRKIRDAGLEETDLTRIVTDLILAAGDTTSHTMQWLLHLLAINPGVQDAVHEGCRGARAEDAASCQMLKGTLRESLRLYPVAPFITRYMQQDFLLDGYPIKTGELVLMSLYTSGRDARYFPEPDAFLPQRWLRTAAGYDGVTNANASLPFAMGARSCIGRKIAETQILVTLMQIAKNFRITTDCAEAIDIKLHLISVPERPVTLTVKPRKKFPDFRR